MTSLVPLMLYGWPVVAIVLFSTMRPEKALLWTIFAGYLLLPMRGGTNIPLLPPLDKHSIPAFASLALCLLMASGRERSRDPWTWNTGWLPSSPIMLALIALSLFSPIGTALTNTESVTVAGRLLPGLQLYDAGNMFYRQLITLTPFILGWRYLGGEEGQRQTLIVLMIAALAYTLPMLYELRMSPSLNRWLYGFHPGSFAQTFRFGGWRSVVFLPHGLWTAVFLAMGVVAAAGLWRIDRTAMRGRFKAATLWLGLVLFVNNSFGAMILGAALGGAARLLTDARALLLAFVIAITAITYPMLRSTNIIPVHDIVQTMADHDVPRMASFAFRVHNEDLLLARANQKPLFGWGGWRRNRVFDDDTGRDLSVTDGQWILTFGIRGWAGYVAEFGLLLVPTILLYLNRRRYKLPSTTPVLALVLAVNVSDMIPNATMTPVTMLAAGSIAGAFELARRGKLARPDDAHARTIAIRRTTPMPPAAIGDLAART